MNYSDFKHKVRKYPYFRANIFEHLSGNPAFLRRQLTDWVKKGWVEKLKRGIYTLSEQDRSVRISAYCLAPILYSPSYISLESALSYYGLIPEGVYAITSVSTQKTMQFHNKYGQFIYRNIKPAFFTDFVSEDDGFGNMFYIATPEKALLDFLFFKTKGMKRVKQDIFENSFRLQNLESVDRQKLKEIAERLGHKKIISIVKSLLELME